MSNENSSKKNQTMKIILSWVVFTSIIMSYILILLPRKGFDLTDEGYYLASAFGILHHQHPDMITKIALGVYVNTLFLKLGITSYLGLRAAFTLTLVSATFIFLIGNNLRLIKSPLLPLTLAASINFYYTTIISYQNAPILFLIAGVGCFFLAIKNKAHISIPLFLISSLLLIVSGFCNLALIPGSLAAWIVLSLQYRQTINIRYFTLAYLLLLITSTLGYFLFISTHSLNNTVNSYYFLSIIPRIKPTLTFMLRDTFFILLFRSMIDFSASYLTISASKKTKILSIAARTLLFAFATYFIYKSYRLTGSAQSFGYLAKLSFLITTTSLIFYLPNNPNQKKILLSFLLVMILYFGQALTTTLSPTFTILYFAPALLALTAASTNKNIMPFCGLMLCLTIAGLYAQFHFSYRSAPPYMKKIELKQTILKNIKTTPEKKAFINTLSGIYRKYDCKDKVFLAMTDQPFLYYLFQRVPPTGSPWYPGVLLNNHSIEKKAIAAFNNKKHWCAFLSSGNTNPKKWKSQLVTLKSYLNHSSQTKIKLNFKSDNPSQAFYSHYTIYVN